jgi:hypothetical protein
MAIVDNDCHRLGVISTTTSSPLTTLQENRPGSQSRGCCAQITAQVEANAVCIPSPLFSLLIIILVPSVCWPPATSASHLHAVPSAAPFMPLASPHPSTTLPQLRLYPQPLPDVAKQLPTIKPKTPATPSTKMTSTPTS